MRRRGCFKCKYLDENVLRNTKAKVTSYVKGSYLSSLLCKLLLCDFTKCIIARYVLTFTLPTCYEKSKSAPMKASHHLIVYRYKLNPETVSVLRISPPIKIMAIKSFLGKHKNFTKASSRDDLSQKLIKK